MPNLACSHAAVAVWIGLAWIGLAHATAPAAPAGRLPETIRPTAYHLDLTIDPAAARFSGHCQIDAVLTQPTRTIFLHGRDLKVTRAQVATARATIAAQYTEVADLGVARLDLPKELAAGKVKLSFDYSAGFRTGDEGLFHGKVGKHWYAWTQMEAIDARRVFPGFDEPGFKTPFSVTVSAPTTAKVFANAPQIAEVQRGAWRVHRFAPTKPLPTYLLALGVGPFDVIETTVPPNSVRAQPLPFRVIATQGQTARMQLTAREAPKILSSLESYLGSAYPYDKLDFLASPFQGGAMENAGLIIFSDASILMDAEAPLKQLRQFAEYSAHEMAHQWFGDLVTPTWWTDIWLNESFAEWMGKKVADQWRPDLGIAVSELEDAFGAMDTDALGRGRPIRQVITESRQISSAFDSITYQKGAQVLAMFESYLGPESFQKGVRLYLGRYRYGNASADDFFGALGEAAGDPQVIPAMRTFTGQTGVPIVTVHTNGEAISLAQTRYRPLGVDPLAAQTWMIPMCLSRAAARTCTLVDSPSMTLAPLAGDAPLMPNAGGAGYYRFRLDGPDWDRLISVAKTLPGAEALALADSLWSDFTAGTGSFERVIAGARALSRNPERLAVVELALRLQDLANSALDSDEIPAYRRLMLSIYGPQLAALGADLRAGAYAKDPAPVQGLRQSLLPLVALEARDPELRARLGNAAAAYIDGDGGALDPAFRSVGLRVAVQERGMAFMQRLMEALQKSSDPLFRQDASAAIGSADTPDLAEAALELALSPGVQPLESIRIVFVAAQRPATRDTVVNFADKNFARLIAAFPGFARTRFVSVFDGYCAPGDIARIDAYMQPKMRALGGGELELGQIKDRIARCAALKAAQGADIARVLGD